MDGMEGEGQDEYRMISAPSWTIFMGTTSPEIDM